MATTYVGYTDTAGMRILTRESNVRYIIRRPTGKYLINVLGNKDDEVNELHIFESATEAHAWLSSPMTEPPAPSSV